MHARRRSPGGNGYRSGSMGMGSRISPEISGRGHGFYNAEYRNPTRGYGRGQSQMKSFRASPPRQSKSGDIFMEAGKLAAEYLVSKGFLPPSALSGKWQNGSFKKQIGNYHNDFRSQEGDSTHFSSEGRPSALSRLGHSVSDAGQSRRRYTDDYSSSGSQKVSKERRKGGSFPSHSSDWSREYARSGSSSERTRGSHDKEVDSGTVAGNHEEHQVVKDVNNDSQKSDSDDVAPKGEMVHVLRSDSEKQNVQETGSKTSSPGPGKDVEHETVGEPSKGTVESASLVSETGDLKDCSHDNESLETCIKEDSPKQNVSTENASSSKDVTDLLSLGNFAKIPTKTRSSLVRKSSKVQSIPRNYEQNFSRTGADVKFEVAVEDDSVAVSSDDMKLNKTYESDHQNLGIAEDLPVHSVKDAEELGHLFVGEQGKIVRSQSLPDNVLLHVSEPELVQGIPDLQRCSSMVTEVGEKRALEQCDDWNEAKRPRGWLDTTCIKDDAHVSLPEFAHEKGSSEGDRPAPSTSEKLSLPVNHDFMVASSQLTGVGELTDKYSQEKQLIPSSFKICDLNLMEASDVNDNNQNHSIAGCSNSEPNQELAAVDIDLTMRNSNASVQDSLRTSNCSNIEIIDLENDSGPEEQGIDDMKTKNEEVFVDMNCDATNAPDQYDGLLINEYLGNFSSSPPVSADIDPRSLQNDGMNPMPNNIDIHNEEGALGDDDSIYMSLEEIPLSFLQVWGQPPAQ